MILRRLGNKSKLAKEIQKHFPKHITYIEPFFGGGGMFFNKTKAKYNFLNDVDSDVYNLFKVVTEQKDDLLELFLKMPISTELRKYWKQYKESDPLKKALKFIFLSNYGYLGKPDTLRLGRNNTSEILLKKIDKTHELLFGCHVTNYCFREMLNKISFKNDGERLNTLIYCDPPYLGADNNYSHSFNEQDCIDLFDTLIDSKCKFAYSEFNNEFILNQAKERGLQINTINERRTIKSRSVEILVTNYKTAQMRLFDEA